MSGREWTQVTKRKPCPACRGEHWCAWSANGMLKCERNAVPPPDMKVISVKGDGAVFAYVEVSSRPRAKPARWANAAPKAAPEPKAAPKPYQTAEEAIGFYGRALGKPSASWDYHDERGTVVFKALRFDQHPKPGKPASKPKKTFRPVALVPGGWIPGDPPGKLPLYGLPALLAAPRGSQIIVVEGEKNADRAPKLGWTATTSAHGSKSADKSDWSPVRGLQVVVLVDHDKDGETYGRDVASLALRAGALSVRIVRLVELWPAMPLHGDLVDFLENRMDEVRAKEEIEALIQAAQPEKDPPADSIRAPIGPGRARIEFNPVPIEDLGPATPPKWVWTGYVAREHTTLFSGLWKAGKSTLLGWLLHDLHAGGGLVPEPLGVRTLVISEESGTLWCRRRDEMGLTNAVHVLSRPFKGKSSWADWMDFLEQLAILVKSRGYEFVVLDTIGAFWPVDNENDASEVLRAVMPLHEITEAGAGILLIHHPRKGDAQEGQAARGSGALPGFVDIIVELRRHRPDDASDCRRVLKTFSRFDESPAESVLELTDSGYVCIGDRAETTKVDRQERLLQLLPSNGPGMTVDEVHVAWGTKPVPGKRAIAEDLQAGATEGRWARGGKGAKGNPYRYWVAAKCDSSKATPLGARIESKTGVDA